MPNKSNNLEKEVAKKVVSGFDFVIDSLINFIGVVVTIFLPVSSGVSQGVSNTLAKNKYEIVKIFCLILLLTVLLVLVLVNISSDSKDSKKNGVDLGKEATDISGVKAIVLNVPYFNQLLEKNGTQAPLKNVGGGYVLGGVICGAASSTMVAGYFGKIKWGEDELDLKPYAYEDRGLGLPSKCLHYGVGGTFGMTAFDSLCNQSGVAGIQAYFSQLGVATQTGWGSPDFATIKNAIDNNKPVIISLTTFEGFGHLAVIKGYTEDGRFVMNDPWTDVQSGNRKYSFKGKNALYDSNLGSQGSFKYYLIIG